MKPRIYKTKVGTWCLSAPLEPWWSECGGSPMCEYFSWREAVRLLGWYYSKGLVAYDANRRVA